MANAKVEKRPLRIGFVGVGWIGRQRMQSLTSSGLVEVGWVSDPSSAAAVDAVEGCSSAVIVGDLDDMILEKPDGIVIATPSAFHAEQSIECLNRGIPVFCQKPLGRNLRETKAVIDAARRADRLLGVDLSYREAAGIRAIKKLVGSGELGEIVAVEAIFHNAYGPDKPWFYERSSAGGGCLIDLGIHLVDLAFWCDESAVVESVSGWVRESDRGEPGNKVEDHAAGLIRLKSGAVIQMACSWGSHAGCGAEIRIQFFGTKGGACFRNIGGSFYDFKAERYHPDTTTEVLAVPPDAWNGRCIVRWAEKLERSSSYCPEIESLEQVAGILDQIYDQQP